MQSCLTLPQNAFPLEAKVAFPYTRWEIKTKTRVSLRKMATFGMRDSGDQVSQ